MDITQLKCFIAVAQTLSFTEAARRVGMTQPGISHHIGELEKQLGARLFNRSSRSVEMTAAGKEFLPYAVDIVKTAEKAVFRVRQVESGAVGHVSVSAVSTSSAIVSRCLSAFYKKHPNILVDISFTSGNSQIFTLGEHAFDFHFVLLDYIPAGSAFEYIVTHEDHLCVILPKDHPCASEPLDFNKLKNEPFVTFDESEGPALYAQIMNICKHFDYTPRIVNRYDRAEAVLLSVGAGLGISIIPKALCDVFYSDNVAVKPIAGVDTRRTYVLAWRAPLKSPAAEMFLETAKELFCPAEGI